jgi:hypothetical protein
MAVDSRPGIDSVDVFGRFYDWPPEREAGGQCMDCGFLARRSTDPARLITIEEVSVETRKAGQLFQTSDGHPSVPWCYLRVADLQRETEGYMAAARAGSELPDFVQVTLPEIEVTKVLVFDRKCPQWTWYVEGLGPPEHRAERQTMRLEKDRRELQEKLTAMEMQQRTDYKNLRTHADEIAARRERFTFRAFVALGMVGVVLALLAIAATLYPGEMRDLIGGFLRLFSR